MGKISPVATKYIINATIEVDGIVDRPDIIGAIFGQTEGLLGAGLELRELQRSGKIGRIEVQTETKGGKTKGVIVLPSSLDKAETAIVGAALEAIQRIGPCNARLKTESMEDVRVSKRALILERAKALLQQLNESSMPDSSELADEVSSAVRVTELKEYGRERLPAGPAIDESEDIIIVEGRADVLTMLKHGFKNVIAMNGTAVPETIKELCRHKETTVFVDGDRGGELILRELLAVTDIDFVARAPDGKEVEELTKKEIHKALRGRIAAEQAKLEFGAQPSQVQQKPRAALREPERGALFELLNSLVGTRGAYVLDQKLNPLCKVPLTELEASIRSIATQPYAIVLDGVVGKELQRLAEQTGIKVIVAMDSKIQGREGRLRVLTTADL